MTFFIKNGDYMVNGEVRNNTILPGEIPIKYTKKNPFNLGLISCN